MLSKDGNAEKIYINEIIRVTYKCNWSCKFCNVLKTNNFGENDVSDKEVIYQILNLVRKYSFSERQNLILSFSGGEPTLNKNLLNYIRLAKEIGVKIVEIQTNGTRLFKQKEYILDLINAGLDEIFLAQHSANETVNKKMGSIYKVEDFINWTKYILNNKIDKKISIYLNIVITSMNIYSLYEYINFLIEIGFMGIIPDRGHTNMLNTRKISFGFVQPNGYANLNKDEVLLKYTDLELKEIARVIELCKENNILPDFHFVCPPLCILDYPEYNLEHERLKKLENDTLNGEINKSNLESYEFLWKEKRKFGECESCENNKYCLGFYKNWIEFVDEEYVKEKIRSYLLGKTIRSYENKFQKITGDFGYPIKLAHYERFITFILSSDFKSKRILEIGCGVGLGVQFFKDRGYSIMGIDRNQDSVVVANTLGLPVKCFDLSPDGNLFNKELFDIIYIVNVVNDDQPHVTGNFNEYFISMFENIYSILDIGGKVIFNYQNIYGKLNDDLIQEIINVGYIIIENAMDSNDKKDVFYTLEKVI